MAGLLSLVCLSMGCAHSPERHHPDYPVYHQQVRRVLVLPPEIAVVEELADGSTIRRTVQSRQAQLAALQSVVAVLNTKSYTVQSAGLNQVDNPEVDSLQKLFRSVNRAIQLHTYGPQLYPAKLREFVYEVGPVKRILMDYDSDALVLVAGHQRLSRNRPQTWISIAVVEPGGKIIWYGMQGVQQNIDQQPTNSTYSLVQKILQTFVGVGS